MNTRRKGATDDHAEKEPPARSAEQREIANAFFLEHLDYAALARSHGTEAGDRTGKDAAKGSGAPPHARQRIRQPTGGREADPAPGGDEGTRAPLTPPASVDVVRPQRRGRPAMIWPRYFAYGALAGLALTLIVVLSSAVLFPPDRRADQDGERAGSVDETVRLRLAEITEDDAAATAPAVQDTRGVVDPGPELLSGGTSQEVVRRVDAEPDTVLTAPSTLLTPVVPRALENGVSDSADTPGDTVVAHAVAPVLHPSAQSEPRPDEAPVTLAAPPPEAPPSEAPPVQPVTVAAPLHGRPADGSADFSSGVNAGTSLTSPGLRRPSWLAAPPRPSEIPPVPVVPEATAESPFAARVSPLPPIRLASRAASPAQQPQSGAARAGSARIVVHYMAARGPSAAEGAAGTLRGIGYDGAELRSVAFEISSPNIRFFHDQDRVLAERLRDALTTDGIRYRLRDFVHFTPPPTQGTIEVWVAE